MQNRESPVESIGNSKLLLFKNRWIPFFSVCFVLLFPLQSAFADSSANLQTVYHVYVDDTHIGTVSGKGVVTEIIQKKIKEAQEKYDDVTLTTGENISYIEEKSFHPNYNEDTV